MTPVPPPRPLQALARRLGTWRDHVDPTADSPEGNAWLLRIAAIAMVPLLLAYAGAGAVYGCLPLLTPVGFIDMPGACAWLVVIATLAIALALVDWLAGGDRRPPPPGPRTVTTTHTLWRAPGRPLRRVEVKTTLPPAAAPVAFSFYQRLRACSLLVAAIALASALAGRALLALGMQPVSWASGLAPRAEWPLYPLQWVWPWLLPLANDHFGLGLMGAGGALLALAYFLSWRKVKGAWLPFALIVPLLVVLSHLGSAAYDFAAARGLGGLHDEALVQALAQDPGRHNVYTFLGLWIAIGFASVGMVTGLVLGRSGFLSDD
ncbi:hypothetical protein [Variovorax ginsengisoli]|uniref:Uncharacterized protein n=1 Tax=Variovorax ginsengisoli TaxID=363844 RepID=A0ABT9S1S0_9BURK|nr:hypothetical protein [Variovorax ginsengisoli]MDP9898296.1 hypothetical protein [Variovorax ginsengisoli]